jgi:hydroxymethylbilane synthase
MKKRFVVGTRTSKLALWQTQYVIDELRAQWSGIECEIRRFTTKGDKTLDKPLPEIGGKGLFTEELEEALRRGEIDAAVHSLKDLPVEDAPGLTLGAVAARAEAGDCVVARNGWTLETLPQGAIVGTSSVRRSAQLLAVRPDLDIRSIRGNVETRIRKVREGDYDATVMARAGLERLDLTDHITEHLGFETMLPAPGQGALAVQCRAGDDDVLQMLAAIDEPAVHAAVTAERAFLEGLGGGCSAPVGAFAVTAGTSPPWQLEMTAVVGSPDGGRMIRLQQTGDEPESLGKTAAREALDRGAGAILAQCGSTPQASLKGKRVVVTRAREQSAGFCRRLEAAGAEPVFVPVIRIVPVKNKKPIDDCVAGFRQFDWAVFTSVNGVKHWWSELAERNLDAGMYADVKVAAVGAATAEALRERGVDPDFVPEKFVGEQIGRGMEDIDGKRICLLRAKVAGDELPEILRARGAEVLDVPVYENVPVAIEPESAAALKRGVDIVTFTSGSTAINFVAAVNGEPELEGTLAKFRCACIGPVTAETARELELNICVVADVHTTDGLFDALAAYFDKEIRQ